MKPFEVGKTYKTRDGRSVRILCTDAKGTAPLVGLLLQSSGEEWMRRWGVDGLYANGCCPKDDLLPEPNTITVWLTLYENGVGGVYCTPEEADRWADRSGSRYHGKFLRIQEFTYEVES